MLDPVMIRLPEFLTGFDRRAWRAALVTAGLLMSVGLIFLFGKTQLGIEGERAVTAWLEGFAGSPWGLLAAVIAFTVSAYLGVPQFLLIAACVVAFGPWLGFAYSWVATVVSAAVTFLTGRAVGSRALERFGGRRLNRMSGFVGRNAFASSFIIRNVPSAPFVMVNMAFGASRAPFAPFLAGCALGVLPKTALVALFGASFLTAVSGDGVWSSAIVAGIGLAWLALMLLARHLWERRRRASGDTEP